MGQISVFNGIKKKLIQFAYWIDNAQISIFHHPTKKWLLNFYYIWCLIKTYWDRCNKKKPSTTIDLALNLLRSSRVLKPHALSSLVSIDLSIPRAPCWRYRVANSLYSLGFSQRLKFPSFQYGSRRRDLRNMRVDRSALGKNMLHRPWSLIEPLLCGYTTTRNTLSFKAQLQTSKVSKKVIS